MMMDVSLPQSIAYEHIAYELQNPDIQKATGKTNPVDVMGKLREMKNSYK
jgi:hydroxyacylglutathione hydrolase